MGGFFEVMDLWRPCGPLATILWSESTKREQGVGGSMSNSKDILSISNAEGSADVRADAAAGGRKTWERPVLVVLSASDAELTFYKKADGKKTES